jgi:hypothetical protein
MWFDWLMKNKKRSQILFRLKRCLGTSLRSVKNSLHRTIGLLIVVIYEDDRKVEVFRLNQFG